MEVSEALIIQALLQHIKTRMDTGGQLTGGERGTGIEPSPRKPAWSRVIQPAAAASGSATQTVDYLRHA